MRRGKFLSILQQDFLVEGEEKETKHKLQVLQTARGISMNFQKVDLGHHIIRWEFVENVLSVDLVKGASILRHIL